MTRHPAFNERKTCNFALGENHGVARAYSAGGNYCAIGNLLDVKRVIIQKLVQNAPEHVFDVCGALGKILVAAGAQAVSIAFYFAVEDIFNVEQIFFVSRPHLLHKDGVV